MAIELTVIMFFEDPIAAPTPQDLEDEYACDVVVYEYEEV